MRPPQLPQGGTIASSATKCDVCSIAEPHGIFYLWRPFLNDPRDDLVLELAVEAGVTCIVTHNRRDFAGAEQFGIQVLSPGAFLRLLEAHV